MKAITSITLHRTTAIWLSEPKRYKDDEGNIFYVQKLFVGYSNNNAILELRLHSDEPVKVEKAIEENEILWWSN